MLDRLQSDGYFFEPILMRAVGLAVLDFLIPLKCSMIEIQKHLAYGQEEIKLRFDYVTEQISNQVCSKLLKIFSTFLK